MLNLVDVIAKLSLEIVLFDMIFWKGKQVSSNLFLLHSGLPLKLGLRSFSSLFRRGTEGEQDYIVSVAFLMISSSSLA